MKTMMINSDAMMAGMKALLDPIVIPSDGEFQTVIGRSREELMAVLDSWPISGRPTAEQVRLARQSILQLWGYPHRQFEYIEATYGISHEQIVMLKFYWDGWSDGSNPDDLREFHDMPLELHLFGEVSSSENATNPQTPLFLRIDSDIAEFFKEGTRKEYYKGIYDVLRAYVDDQKAK